MREGLQRHGRQQEDDREHRQQGVERDLVRRLLPVGALDEGDHPVEERLAGPGGDAHHDLVGQHPGAAGDRRAVAARLADDGRRLAGDGRLVDRRDALDDLAVGRDHLPGGHDHDVVDGSCDDGTCSMPPSARRRLAIVSARVLRSVAACALPRPSAIASAKLANSTVNHSHAATRPVNRFCCRGRRTEVADEQDVVRALPTSTTNMTGLRAWTRGSSLRKLSTIACAHDGCLEQRPRLRAAGAGCRGGGLVHDTPRGELLDDGTERERREERQAADDHDDADDQADEQRRVGREGALGGRQHPLAGQRAGDGEHRDDQEEPADRAWRGRGWCPSRSSPR